MIEKHELSQAGAIINSSDILSDGRVFEDVGSERTKVVVRLDFYSEMVLDHPGDLVRLIRKIRGALPKQYPVEFRMKTVM